MIVGCVKEVKSSEYRVGLRPVGAEILVSRGHTVLVESGAGLGSGLPDEAYEAVGAKILATPDEVWGEADLIVKVKEPQPDEWPRMRRGQTVFTYFHFAADKALTEASLERGIDAVAYETLEQPGRLGRPTLPLLTPMSEIAGRMATQEGAKYLERPFGGAGVLLGGVPGVEPGNVLVIGGGVVGANAATIAYGMGAHVVLLERDIERMRYLGETMPRQLITVYSDPESLRQYPRVGGPGHRRGAAARRRGAEAHQARAPVDDEARLGDRGRGDRPGGLRGDEPRHDAHRPGLPGGRRLALLRGQHARRRRPDQHLGPDERDAALARGPRRPRLADHGRGGPGVRPGGQRLRGPAAERTRRERARYDRGRVKTLALAILIGAAPLALGAEPAPDAPEPGAPAPDGAPALEDGFFIFEWERVPRDVRRHRAVVEAPEGDWNGWVAVLLGGGLVSDEAWTVPGVVDGRYGEQQYTISGRDTRDAEAISGALRAVGYRVVRWSSIHEDDPARAENPAFSTPLQFPESIRLTRRMLDVCLPRAGAAPGRTLFVGHSLGASRACLTAREGEAGGFVFLAGAYLSLERDSPRLLAAGALDERGSGSDGVVTRAEWEADGRDPDDFDRADADGTGDLRGWEVASADRVRAIEAGEASDRAELPFSERWRDVAWPVERLAELDAPALAVFGSLDPISVHGPLLEALAERRGFGPVTTVYYPEFGHQLSQVDELGRVGPIDERALGVVAAWAAALAEGAE